MSMIMSFVTISFKKHVSKKLLELQDEIMSSPYDKKCYTGYIQHCEQIVYTRNFYL